MSSETPSSKSLIRATLISVVAAIIILLVAILPAEYGVDPTGLGGAMGLTELNADPFVTIEITDVIGGNEVIREVEIPDYGEPTPLPNPAVFQDQEGAPETRTLEVLIPAESQTEIKLLMQEGKVALYSWSVDQGDIYVDFHGHDEAFGPDFLFATRNSRKAQAITVL